MKRLAFCLSLSAAAACGGGSKSSSTTPAPSGNLAELAAPDCKAAADHLAAGNADLAGALESRCATDQWSDEARACLAEKSEDACPLTDAQKASVAEARAAAAPAPTSAAAPPAAPPAPPAEEAPKTRGAVKKKPGSDGKTADPCEGGE